MLLALTIAMATLKPSVPPDVPKPSPRQLAWHKLEYYAFVHFGPNTFSDQEWGHGTENPDLFNPTQLDCRQWARTFRDAGMKQVIVTAKHHDGFCLWPSRYSRHTVAQSQWKGGKGDVLAELRKACDEYGLKMGVYLSPWDRNHPSYGTPEYNQVFAGMLEEVLTKYGPIYEVWFDGANGEGPNGKRQVYDWDLFLSTVRKHAPDAVIFSDNGPDIRWVGNESGIAGETCWATIDRKNPKSAIGAADTKYLNTGDPNGPDWVPAECDVSIRPGWFYHASEDAKVKTPAQLMDIWEKSVGRGANLLLNVPPDRRGLIHENDVKALIEFRRLRECKAGTLIQVVPGNRSADSDLPADNVVLREELESGQRVRGYELTVHDLSGKTHRFRGESIGAGRLIRFPTAQARRIAFRPTGGSADVGTIRIEVRCSVPGELAARVAADQKAREGFENFNALPQPEKLKRIEAMAAIDKANTARMKEIVATYGWPTASLFGKQAAHDAWLLVQHADADPKFQEDCLKLMEPLVKTGEVRASDWAYLTDRVLCAQGKNQRYGTQNVLDGKTWVMKPVEDPANLDKRRAEVGLIPVADYNEFIGKLMAGQVGRSETKAQKDKRMAWFREARFGMFIHWGLYAIPAGEWKGKNYPGASEWLMYSAKIPVADYQPLQKQFNPYKYDAKRWAQIAKDAGMKYIVITSKHHDGFALFDSKLTDWDILNTPFQRDALKELAAACKAAGIKLCFYHSIMDWTHPDYGLRRPWDPRPGIPTNMDRYTVFMKGQLKELLTNYGDIGILWFDGEWEPEAWTHERGVDLYHYVRSLQPNIIVNNRVDVHRSGMAGMSGSDEAVGDYGTPEQEIPANGLPGVDWESCMTMNGSWGFHKNDHNWKSAPQLARNLVDCASKGGNYLLNVGPNAEGEIPEPSVQRLAEVGAWLKQHGEAIYGTQPGPFTRPQPWGRATRKGSKLYLFLFDPSVEQFELAGLQTMAMASYRFLDKKPVKLQKTESGYSVKNPEPKVFVREPMPEVFVIEFKGKIEAVQPSLRQAADGSIVLPAADATVRGTSAAYEADAAKQCIGFWTNPADVVEWEFAVTKAGVFAVSAEVAAPADSAGAEFEIRAGTDTVRGKVPDTGGWASFRILELGRLRIQKAGKVRLTVKPLFKPGYAVMNLRSVRLAPP